MATGQAQTKKQRALIARWRQAANEATTADAAVTYTDCANELEAAIAVRVLIAICEGCGAEIPMPTQNPRKIYADLPAGWSQSGISRHHTVSSGASRRLAAWCPACRVQRAGP